MTRSCFVVDRVIRRKNDLIVFSGIPISEAIFLYPNPCARRLSISFICFAVILFSCRNIKHFLTGIRIFPAFEERASNIYRAIFYTKDTSIQHDDFVAAVFMSQLPMPADEQKELFKTIMQASLDEECSYKVMQAVHESVMEKMEAQKESKAAEPVRLTKYDVIEAMEECGVSTEHMDAFTESFDREFGAQAKLSAVNVTNPKQFEIKTPNATLKVDADRSDLVETREIDGHTYVMLRADDGIEVIGVNIATAQQK